MSIVSETITFAYFGEEYTVRLSFEKGTGWWCDDVQPRDEHFEWVAQAAVERMEYEDRDSWFQAKAEGYL